MCPPWVDAGGWKLHSQTSLCISNKALQALFGWHGKTKNCSFGEQAEHLHGNLRHRFPKTLGGISGGFLILQGFLAASNTIQSH